MNKLYACQATLQCVSANRYIYMICAHLFNIHTYIYICYIYIIYALYMLYIYAIYIYAICMSCVSGNVCFLFCIHLQGPGLDSKIGKLFAHRIFEGFCFAFFCIMF